MSLLEVLNGQQSQGRADAQIQERYERATATLPGGDKDPYQSMVGQLEAYLESCWQSARIAKEMKVEPEMLEDLRQREGVYSPQKLAEIRQQGGSEIFMQLTNLKSRACLGWLRDVLLPSGERPFTCKAPAMPDDIPPEIKQGIYSRTMAELDQAMAAGIYPTEQQVYERSRAMYDQYMQRIKDEAEIRVQREEDAIDDELIEGAWYEAMDEFLQDLVDLPAAFIKGPVVRKQRRLKWVPGPDGRSVPQAEDELTPMFYSPSPMDMYPAGDSTAVNDGYLFERIRPRRSALFAMKGVPGYDEDKIKAALDEYQRSGYNLTLTGEQQRRDIANQSMYLTTPDHAIDGLEFHGSVRGQWLIDWGMPEKDVPDPDAEYEVTCLKIGRFVVRCVLNEDPMQQRPYMKACFDSIKGSFWGRGLPRILRDIQNICNAVARALVNNLAMASGPMVEVEMDRLAEGENVTQIYPWRIWQTKASRTTPGAAVRFFQPDIHANELMAVYQYFSKLADDYSGVPSYEQGINPTGGAAGTASGLSMLMSAASRQIKRVISAIDSVIEGSVQRMHVHLMLYGDNTDIKGETTIQARGAASLVAKEQQQQRRVQLLQSTANPFDAPLFGPDGRAEMWRETLKSMDINPDRILPSRDEMLMRQAATAMTQNMQPQPGAAPGAGAPPPQQAGNGQPPQRPGVVPLHRQAAPQRAVPDHNHAGARMGGMSHALFAQAA
jgi:hypothetical protein